MNYREKSFKSSLAIIIFTTLLIFVLLTWSLLSFLGISSETFVNIMNVILGLVGFLSMLGIAVSLVLSVYYVLKHKPDLDMEYDERSGKGSDSEIPEKIKKWNWGAAGLTWIWGLNNSVWISLLIFIPYLNLIWWIVLGIKGNEWAWKKNKWKSVDNFLNWQRKWKPWGIFFFILILLMVAVNASIFTIQGLAKAGAGF